MTDAQDLGPVDPDVHAPGSIVNLLRAFTRTKAQGVRVYEVGDAPTLYYVVFQYPDSRATHRVACAESPVIEQALVLGLIEARRLDKVRSRK